MVEMSPSAVVIVTALSALGFALLAAEYRDARRQARLAAAYFAAKLQAEHASRD